MATTYVTTDMHDELALFLLSLDSSVEIVTIHAGGAICRRNGELMLVQVEAEAEAEAYRATPDGFLDSRDDEEIIRIIQTSFDSAADEALRTVIDPDAYEVTGFDGDLAVWSGLEFVALAACDDER